MLLLETPPVLYFTTNLGFTFSTFPPSLRDSLQIRYWRLWAFLRNTNLKSSCISKCPVAQCGAGAPLPRQQSKDGVGLPERPWGFIKKGQARLRGKAGLRLDTSLTEELTTAQQP